MHIHNICISAKITEIVLLMSALSGASVIFLVGLGSQFAFLLCLVPDQKRYLHNTFFISPQKFMLWVFIRGASVRHF